MEKKHFQSMQQQPNYWINAIAWEASECFQSKPLFCPPHFFEVTFLLWKRQRARGRVVKGEVGSVSASHGGPGTRAADGRAFLDESREATLRPPGVQLLLRLLT